MAKTCLSPGCQILFSWAQVILFLLLLERLTFAHERDCFREMGIPSDPEFQAMEKLADQCKNAAALQRAEKYYRRDPQAVKAPAALYWAARYASLAKDLKKAEKLMLEFIDRYHSKTCGYGYMLQMLTWTLQQEGKNALVIQYGDRYLREFPLGHYADVVRLRVEKARNQNTRNPAWDSDPAIPANR